MLLLDLENCDAGYSPTRWQRDCLPALFHDKVRVIFDGVDTNIWKRSEVPQPRRFGPHTFPDDVKIVTYATRGMESMRGFDIFMKVAKVLCDRRKDVVFLVAGQDRVCYGGDQSVTGPNQTFKEWVLSTDNYDLSRFVWLDLIPPNALADLFSLTDLHVYLTVPFVLSWSLMNALSCGATVLGSRTGPVEEMIRHEENGLLADFSDIEGLADQAERVLDDPAAFRHLGEAGSRMIRERYSLDVCLPQMLELYEDVMNQRA